MLKPFPLIASIALLLGGNTIAIAAAPKAELSVLTTLRTTPRTKGTPAALNPGAAFIVAHDAITQRVFVTNAVTNSVDVIDVSNIAALALPPNSPVLELAASTSSLPSPFTRLDMRAYGASPLSVTTYNGLIAVSMQNAVKTLPGKVVFFDSTLQPLCAVDVGAYPDMITFSPSGRYVLVANEGEPSSYLPADLEKGSDPEGSVTIIDLQSGFDNLAVRKVGFEAFNGHENELRARGIRVFGTGADVSHDLEPEYIAVSQDSKTAWVTLQDNNALAIIDIPTASVRKLVSLGEKNHNLKGNGIDPSSADGGVADANGDNMPDGIKIKQWPVFGLYQSDAIAAYRVRGKDYLVLANEGDSRSWPGLNEETTVGAVELDADAFPDSAVLKAAANLGQLKITAVPSWAADKDGNVKPSNQYVGVDGKTYYKKLYSFGARSFSIRDSSGHLVWDSGDAFERITADAAPLGFNTSHDKNNFENRSPSKGPEPEGVTLGRAYGRTYAFIGLERIGGVMVYDITEPTEPEFVQYINQRDFSKAVTSHEAGDLGPEGLVFINEENSPTGTPLLVVVHEYSGTTTIFEVKRQGK